MLQSSRVRYWRIALVGVIALAVVLIVVTMLAVAANTIVWQTASTGLPTSGIIRDVAFGDVNNDGKPDMVVAGNVGVVVYIGNGAGVWNGAGFSTGLPASGQYGHVVVADFNNDGKLDIAASQGSNLGVQAWTGNGAGSWTAWAGLPVTGTYEGLAFADVNKDGWPDLIVGGGAPVSTGVLVFQNNFASFSQTTSITTTGMYVDIAAGYIDNDGYVDVAAAATSAGLKFWRGNANNAWIYASAGLTSTNNFRGVVFGDVDLDGKPELVAARSNVASSTGGGLFVYDYDINTANWSLAPNQLPITDSYFKLSLADLNNDGWLDLVAGGGSTFLSPGIFTWLGSLNGFVATTSPTTTNSWERATVGDFDRNGLLDIGAGAYNGGGAQAWRSTGVRDPIGAWTLIASPQITDSPRALWAGDINRDGDTDVIFNRASGGLNLFRGDGGNAWTYCPAFSAPGGAYTGTYESVVAAPFDRNTQNPQIVGGRSDGGGLWYFYNYSNDCSYFPGIAITSTGSYRGLSAADIDNNGYFNLVAAPSHLLNIGLRVWENGPNGWVLSATPVPTGTYYDTALADFNHDGDLDIAAADGNGGGVAVFQTGRWFRRTITSTGEYYAIAAGDLNNDGHPDVVAAKNGSASEQGIYIWLGDGTGLAWTPMNSPATSGQYFDLALGDVNHDGWLDILAARDGLGVMVWLGDGAGNWTPSNTNLPITGAFFASQFSHVDHDGNLDIVSTGLNQGVQVWTAAEAAPPTISNIRPSGWITTTQTPTILGDVLDTGSGISVTSGLYRFSTNGGSTWSAFAPASISGSTGSTSTQSITALNVPFGQDSGTQNKIEFRASDVVGNLGTAQATIKIDITPPTAPTAISSSDHTVNVWSNDNTISLNWSGAADATSGVYAYAVLFDHNPTALPPMTVNAFAGSFTSGALADGNNWYAHVRTVDVAGNWSTTAIHLGPFKIDTVPPTNPTSVSSADHTLGVWSADPTISMIWSGATDAASGVSGYSYVFDTSSGTLPDTTVDTSGTSATSASLPSGNNKYFHIRTRDAAGNWSTTAVQAGAYWIDVTPPSSFASSPGSVGSTTFFVSWSGSDAHSGLASYDVQYRDSSTGGSWTTWQSFTTSTGAWFYGSGGHIYQFRSRARDHAGNLEAYPAGYDSQTSVATIDLYMRSPGIEVNQEVQDLNNSVTLIANKRTFVRCYAQSSGGTFYSVPGRLYVYRGATFMGSLVPSNSGGSISVKSSPDRNQLNDAYYFDVPTGWLNAGSVTFQCEVNTPLKYADYNYGNDLGSVTVNFNSSPPMNLVIVDVPYRSGGVTQHVRNLDRTLLESYIRRAYPINSLTVKWAYLDPPYGSLPDAGTVDNDLFWDKFWNPFKFFPDFYARYYGMAIDTGGFMRGLAGGIPSTVAAGPAGVSCCGGSSSWDPDGSYGDWYGAHELGHTYGRYHAEFCGATGGAAYPYPNGDISPSQVKFSASTLYGFDTSNPTVIPPSWKDVMTYCSNEWLSDFTYEGIRSRMVAEKGALQAQTHQQNPAASEHLVVTGRIVTPTDVITLSTFFRVPNSLDSIDHVPGDYHIRLLDTNNAQLLDYPFMPKFSPEDSEPIGLIAEAVPWITGTHSIVILHGTAALITRTVSANTPVVAVTAPNGGEVLSGGNYTVTWTASDADLDPLTYLLEYSTDNGATWQLLGTNITRTQATLDLSLLPGTTQGLFRVWASDGVNTAFDASDAVFSVPSKLPSITSISPISGTTYVLSQTVTLEGSAYDPEDNVLGDAQLQWTSNLQGALGTGAFLQITDLITGTHVITLTATDSDNNVATATTVITVGEESTGGGSAPDVFLPLVIKNG